MKLRRSNSVKQQKSVEEEKDVKPRCCHTPFFIKLLRWNAPEKYYLFLGCLCSLLFGAVEPAVGYIYSIIYGLFAIPNLEDQSSRTRDLSLTIFGVYVFAGLAQCVSTLTFAKSGEALTMRMRLETFDAMLRREISWFDSEKNSVGSLITRLANDTAAMKVNLPDPYL